ncbi:hypothetical protein ADUPG1_006793, partial [Aduncisulcus paluster]
SWYWIEIERYSSFQQTIIESGVDLFSPEYVAALDSYEPFSFVSPYSLYHILTNECINCPRHFTAALEKVRVHSFSWECLDDISWFPSRNGITLTSINKSIPKTNGIIFAEYEPHIITPIGLLDFTISHIMYGSSKSRPHSEESLFMEQHGNWSKIRSALTVPNITPDIENILITLKSWYWIEIERYSSFQQTIIESGVDLFSPEYVAALDSYEPFSFVSPYSLYHILTNECINCPRHFTAALEKVRVHSFSWECLDDISWFPSRNGIISMFIPIVLAKISPGRIVLYMHRPSSIGNTAEFSLRSILCRGHKLARFHSNCYKLSEMCQYLLKHVLIASKDSLTNVRLKFINLSEYIPIFDFAACHFSRLNFFLLQSCVVTPSSMVRLLKTISSFIRPVNRLRLCGETLFLDDETVVKRSDDLLSLVRDDLLQFHPDIAISNELSTPISKIKSIYDCVSTDTLSFIPEKYDINLEHLEILKIQLCSVKSCLYFLGFVNRILLGSSNLKYLTLNDCFENIPLRFQKQLIHELTKSVFNVIPNTIEKLSLDGFPLSIESIQCLLSCAKRNDIRLSSFSLSKCVSLQIVEPPLVQSECDISDDETHRIYKEKLKIQKNLIQSLLEYLIFVTSPVNPEKRIRTEMRCVEFSSCPAMDLIAFDEELRKLFDIFMGQIISHVSEIRFANSYRSIEFVKLVMNHVIKADNLLLELLDLRIFKLPVVNVPLVDSPPDDQVSADTRWDIRCYIDETIKKTPRLASFDIGKPTLIGIHAKRAHESWDGYIF